MKQAQQEAVAHAEKLRRKRRPRLTPYTMPLSPSKTGPSNNTNKGGRPTPTSDIRSILRNTSRKRAPKLSGSESCSRAAGRGRAPRSPIGNTAANASQGSVGSASRGSDQGPRPPGAKDSARWLVITGGYIFVRMNIDNYLRFSFYFIFIFGFRTLRSFGCLIFHENCAKQLGRIVFFCIDLFMCVRQN